MNEITYERGMEVLAEMRQARDGDDGEGVGVGEAEPLPCGCIPGVQACPEMEQIQQRLRSTWYLSEWREHNRWLTAQREHWLPTSDKAIEAAERDACGLYDS